MRLTSRLPRRPTAALALAAFTACSGVTEPEPFFPDEPAPDPQPEFVAFVDVNLITMQDSRVLAGHTVLTRNDRIVEIGPVASVTIPAGAFRIEGAGRYLLPGLTDMHVHLTSGTFANLRNDFMVWLANGVTTVRVMWGSAGTAAERDRIEAGEILGPALLVASPGIDAPGGVWTGSTPPVATPEEARQRVADHAAVGYDFIKVYNDLTRGMYDAIVAEAAVHGIPVVGHVPSRVGVDRVLDAGQLTLEHLIGFHLEASTPYLGGSLNTARIQQLAARSATSRSWHTPTTEVDGMSQPRVQEIRTGEEIKHISPGMRQFFTDGFFHGNPASAAAREEANQEVMTRAIRDAGGRLLTGTDAGFGWILPGYSIHDELAHFRHAGLTAFETLRTATSDAARSVNRAGVFGTVAVGARADLILVSRNPLDDLSRLRKPNGVMVRGRWLSAGTLDARLAAIRASYGL